MAKYIILPSRLPKNYMSSWRDILSYQVDFLKIHVVMAKYIILTSGLPKKLCRHGEIYYLAKSTSQNYKSTWRHKLSYQVDLTKKLCRHGEIYYLTKSTKWRLQVEKLYVVMARYIILPSRLPKKYMSSWRHNFSYQVDLTKIHVVMATYIILTSRLPKKLYVVMARYIILPSRLSPLLGGGGGGKTPKCTDKLPTHRLMHILSNAGCIS